MSIIEELLSLFKGNKFKQIYQDKSENTECNELIKDFNNKFNKDKKNKFNNAMFEIEGLLFDVN